MAGAGTLSGYPWQVNCGNGIVDYAAWRALENISLLTYSGNSAIAEEQYLELFVPQRSNAPFTYKARQKPILCMF